ncbi:MAG: GPW/gp25 family protein [Solirubrobacteraceae bacterium]
MTTLARRDYAFPLRIDGGSQQTAQTAYAAHVMQMVQQLLLTTPGERVNNPQFGCGLRAMVFAPMSQALQATARIQVTQAIGQWLAGVVTVNDVEVSTADSSAALEPGTLVVTVTYTLIETQTSQQTTVTLI